MIDVIQRCNDGMRAAFQRRHSHHVPSLSERDFELDGDEHEPPPRNNRVAFAYRREDEPEEADNAVTFWIGFVIFIALHYSGADQFNFQFP